MMGVSSSKTWLPIACRTASLNSSSLTAIIQYLVDSPLYLIIKYLWNAYFVQIAAMIRWERCLWELTV